MKKHPLLVLVSAISSLAVLAPSSTSAALLIYEPFDYVVGEQLNGQNGGIGFTNAWNSGTFPTATIVAGSLSVPGVAVPTMGNSVDLSGLSGTLTMFRSFAEIAGSDGTSTWISFIAQRVGVAQDPPVSGTNPYARGVNVSFFDTTATPAERVGLGNSSNALTDAWSIIPQGSSAARVPTTTPTTPWSTLAWGVMRIDHVGDSSVFDNAYLWINPDPNVEPLIANAAASSLNAYDFSNLDSVRPFVGGVNGATPYGQLLFDELRIGTDYASMSAVPEPGIVALVALGGLGLLLRRRR